VLNLGDLGDPLATDDITEFSKKVIPYVASKENVKLFFLTKSTNVNNLLNLEHNNRTILSWSVNCDLIAEKPTLTARMLWLWTLTLSARTLPPFQTTF
jgi:spore photoproduct lyase